MKRYYFIGIGGAGMSAIAHILRKRGAEVAGSDRCESEVTERLRREGITVHIGHDGANVKDVDVLVYSAAIPQDNPEMVRARELGIEIYERPVMLGMLMDEYKNRVAVAGTHGKTTTTSMLSCIFAQGGIDSTDLIGGDLSSMGGNARLGKGDMFLTEACEAFGSFYHLRPSVAVITNIDADHLDFYGDYQGVEDGFVKFSENLDPDGVIVMCGGDENSVKAAKRINRKIVWTGIDSGDYRAKDAKIDTPRPEYTLVVKGEERGRITLRVPGIHNVYNSLAAAAVADMFGVGFEDIKTALAAFGGAGRRFDLLYDGGVTVVDDYAHHPSEIRTTIEGVKKAFDRKLKVIFQPHLYSRTRDHFEEFAEVLSLADEVMLIPIYPAREEPIPGITSEIISERIPGSRCFKSIDEAVETVSREAEKGDIIMSMGAGTITQVGHKLAEIFAKEKR
ncbi:MAG: UDP-N-acetylmuramate--L-alanine ligase [Abditibacteriota bacterium]|nr:UDP-N-acetylmuramate--L-alanine ligase [Abditibacteriota bacterium]